MEQDSNVQRLQQLQSMLKTAHLRAVFLFQDGNDAHQVFRALRPLYRKTLALSDSDTTDKKVAINRYRDYLGETYDCVALHFDHDLNYDALAALSGTLSGGGVLCISLPAGEVKSSVQRLISHAEAYDLVQVCGPGLTFLAALEKICALLEGYPAAVPQAPAYPTPAQQGVIDHLTAALHDANETQRIAPQLILADRGRGKSTSVGLAIKQCLSTSRRFVVTAPRKASAATLLAAAGGESAQVKFVAWDQLLLSRQHNADEYLVIDEAGAIPQHILQQLIQYFKVWTITTTVDGYEGAGKGFALRLQHQLQTERNAQTQQLDMPLRWSTQDQIEPWLKQALLMESPPSVKRTAHSPSALPNAPLADLTKIVERHASYLTEAELQRVFKLLTDAHYQTSPNDLKLLLDDPTQKLLIATHKEAVIGVVWMSLEGPIPSDLRNAIVQGQRRPAGNLLPQSLAYFSQCEATLKHPWLRIVRVAVTTEYRRQRLGTQLIKSASQVAADADCVGIGTVFGGADTLLQFWQRSGFQLVRQSAKINMASGYAAVTMIKRLSGKDDADLQWLAAAHEFANAEREWRRSSKRPARISTAVLDYSRHLLQAFSAGVLPFDICHFAFLIWLQAETPPNFPSPLVTVLKQPRSAAEIARLSGYESQKALVSALKSRLERSL